MKLVKVTAKEGMRIRIPGENYRVVPKDGAIVQWGMHWARAKARGEIEVADYTAPEIPVKGAGKGNRPGRAGAPPVDNPEVSREVKTPGIA